MYKSIQTNFPPYKQPPRKGFAHKLGDREGREALYITATVKQFEPKGFKLEILEDGKVLALVHKSGVTLWKWDLVQLFIKEQNLLVVFAETEKKGGHEHFHFIEALLYEGLDREKFFDLLAQGKLVVDLRMHLKPNGTVRNHGTGFRLAFKYVKNCYSIVEKLL